MLYNIGLGDRALRLFLALGLGAAIYLKAVEGALAVVAGSVAVILAVTAAVRFCPLYAPFKISTKGNEAN